MFQKAIIFLSSSAFQSITKVLAIAFLARQLTPADFGVFSLAMIIVSIVIMFNAAGLHNYIVYSKEVSRNVLNNITTYSFLLAILFIAVLYTIRNIIMSIYAMDQLLPAIFLLSLLILLKVFVLIPYAQLSRALQYKKLSYVLLISYLLGFALFSIIFALNGYGVYALIYGTIIEMIIQIILLHYYYPYKYGINLNPGIWKETTLHRLQFAFSEFISYLRSQVDNLIVARVLDAQSLGIYTKSYALLKLPKSVIGSSLKVMLFSYYADQKNKSKVSQDKFILFMNLLTFTILPIAIVVFFNARSIILILLGDQWLEAVPILKVFCVSMYFIMLVDQISNYLMSQGHTKLDNKIKLAMLVVLIIIIPIGIRFWGLVGVAWSINIYYALLTAIYMGLLHKLKYFRTGDKIIKGISYLLMSIIFVACLSLFRYFELFYSHYLSFLLDIIFLIIFQLSLILILRKLKSFDEMNWLYLKIASLFKQQS